MNELKKRRSIIIDIMNHTGEVRIEAEGFKGKSCIEATKFIEEALGKCVSREIKPEYYSKEDEKTTLVRSFCG
jgi:hypothetical protein